MSKKITLTRAKNLLKVVPQKESFWLCTNQNLRSLNTLAKALDEVSDDVFRYHVNKYKNDFSTWVRDMISDNDFAREISRIKTKDTLVRKITEKVDESKDVITKYKVIAAKRKKVVKKKPVKKKAKKKAKKKITKKKHAKKKKAKKKKKPVKKKAKKKVAKRRPTKRKAVKKKVRKSKKKTTKKTRKKR